MKASKLHHHLPYRRSYPLLQRPKALGRRRRRERRIIDQSRLRQDRTLQQLRIEEEMDSEAFILDF